MTLLLLGVCAFLYLQLRRSRRKGNLLESEGQALRRDARLQATTDELTGLGNRRALMRALSPDRQDREFAQLCLARINVDGMRRYNEKFGYGAGDGLLARFGRSLAEKFDRGSAYRSSGAEFCVIWWSAPYPSDGEIAEAIADLRHAEDPLVSCSYGTVLTSPGGANANDALHSAERRMCAPAAPPLIVQGVGQGASRPPVGEPAENLVAPRPPDDLG